MAYIIDRTQALWWDAVVAIVAVRRRGVRSRVVLRDNSWYHTLTRPRTLARCVREGALVATRARSGTRLRGT